MVASGSYFAGANQTISTTVSTSGSSFIVPAIANMDASANAVVQTTSVQLETVTIGGIFNTYTYACSANETRTLVRAFDCSANGAEEATNNLNDLTVSFNPSQDVLDLLTKAILTAQNSDSETAEVDLAQNNLKAELLNVLKSSFFNATGSSDVNTIKNSVSLTECYLTLDASGGAKDMGDLLTDDGAYAGKTDAAGYCADIYTQIPLRQLDLYMDQVTDDNNTTSLPLVNGDSLTFVFDVYASAPAIVSSQTNTASVTAGAAAQTAAGLAGAPGTSASNPGVGGDYAPNMLNINYTPDSVRVAFTLVVTDGAGAAGSVLSNI